MATFEREDMSGSEFRLVVLNDSWFRNVDLHRVTMRGVELVDVSIDGEIERVRINGVDVGPLIEAELDRTQPDRQLMRPEDAEGVRAAWTALERLWAGTVERARTLDPEQLHQSVDGEWSFIQTLRHLVFATESWLGRAVLGDPAPWHPLSLPWDTFTDLPPEVPQDRAARPSLDEVLALRADRWAMVQRLLDEMTDERLASEVVCPDAPGWPPAGHAFEVGECLRIVVNEEWHHRLYAERDLDLLATRGTG